MGQTPGPVPQEQGNFVVLHRQQRLTARFPCLFFYSPWQPSSARHPAISILWVRFHAAPLFPRFPVSHPKRGNLETGNQRRCGVVVERQKGLPATYSSLAANSDGSAIIIGWFDDAQVSSFPVSASRAVVGETKRVFCTPAENEFGNGVETRLLFPKDPGRSWKRAGPHAETKVSRDKKMETKKGVFHFHRFRASLAAALSQLSPLSYQRKRSRKVGSG